MIVWTIFNQSLNVVQYVRVQGVELIVGLIIGLFMGHTFWMMVKGGLK